ncbi:unnamed protein product [Amoebophrya sp. A120]|nr:unnamed protein product [Amoebophrya sp. A120]|eukprot:GSA120T00018230001.1
MSQFLKRFCQGARKALQQASLSTEQTGPAAAPSKQPIIFVMGNTSCDLDSVCCALALAYLFELDKTSKTANISYIPLLNYRRQDFPKLLQQAYWLEKYFQISVDDLCFYEDAVATMSASIPAKDDEKATAPGAAAGPPSPACSFLLVDHNEVDPTQRETLRGKVVGCVDHHEVNAGNKVDQFLRGTSSSPDDPAFASFPQILDIRIPSVCGPEAIVGSCSSLILERTVKVYESRIATPATVDRVIAGTTGLQQTELFSELFSLLSGAILCDTRNFADATKGAKWSVKGDKETYETAKQLFGAGTSATTSTSLLPSDEAALCQDLFDIKFDVERNLNLGVSALLGGDYKQFSYRSDTLSVGYATFPIQLVSVLQKFDLEKTLLPEMKDFCESRKVSLLVILSSDRNMLKHFGVGVFCNEETAGSEARNLALSAFNAIVTSSATDASGSLKEEMGLVPIEPTGASATSIFRVYEQRRAEKSRKQVEPLIRQLLNSISSSPGMTTIDGN